MAIKQERYIERVLIVLNADGTLKGAHQETLERTVDDSTSPQTILVERSIPASVVDPTALATVLPSQADLLTQVSSLLNENETLRAENEALKQSVPISTATAIDGVAFLARLTDAEYSAILAASEQSVQLARWLDIFRLRGEIDVTGTTAQAAKAGLVGANLLTQARADEIFATG